jgi:plastocyanin
MPLLLVAAAAALLLALTACEDGGASREVKITQTDQGCTPTEITAVVGEELKLTMSNETGHIYALEGKGGAHFEEVVIPEGKTRSANFTAPDEPGEYSLKCYDPGGVSSEIKVRVGGPS